MPSFYEFFAGGGMARAGLGKGWTCLFANDFDAKKGLTYQLNYPEGNVLRVGDVGLVQFVFASPARPQLIGPFRRLRAPRRQAKDAAHGCHGDHYRTGRESLLLAEIELIGPNISRAQHFA
jgi:site-specific DNA-cytosine methylase